MSEVVHQFTKNATEEVRASLTEYKGHKLIDLRIYYDPEDGGDRRPTKKGITIDAILYGHNHEGKSNNGYWEIPRCYDAGSVTSKPRSKLKRDLSFYGETKNSTRVIDLNNNPNVDYKLTFLKSK